MPGEAGQSYRALGAPYCSLGTSCRADGRNGTQCLLATGEPLEAQGGLGPGQVVVDEAHCVLRKCWVVAREKETVDGPVTVLARLADPPQASVASGGESSVRSTDLCTDGHFSAARGPMTENASMAGPMEGMAERLARDGVTERETEVLVAIAERLRNREIADRLNVSVRTVESHVAALLRKLGVADRAALAEMGMEMRRSARTDTGLSTPLTRLVGRERETGELISLVDAHRLVTLIGPGGVGKTRLALRVATVHSDRFPHGARLADLAPVKGELVGDTVARALGVVPQPGWSLRDVLREVAGGMDGLLVMDNCEHVVAQAAEIALDLLSAGGQLRVLATSREPLGVPGEVSYQVETLPVPDPSDWSLAATAGGYDAVRLFVDRAATASPGFTLTDDIAPAVAALCQRLDGLPLAIELAASRVRSFGPAELEQHLDQRFELLSTGSRTALPRQRTLRGAIDWSYELLDGDERALFDRLGVFPADFDYGAVQSVCAAGDPGGGAAISLLPRLVDKSLVSTVGRGTHRYRLLETIRMYAAERLAASGAETTARRQHAAHYIALAEQGAEQLRTTDQRAWLDLLVTEQPNLRAALAHTVTTGDIECAWRSVAALQRFWDMSGQRREAQEWIQQALDIPDPPATPAAVAGLAAASLILQASDSRAAFDLATQAERLAAGLDDDLTRGQAALAVGMSAVWVQPELVLPALHEALTRFGDVHPWESAVTLQGLAITSGGLAEALKWGRESVALFRSVGDHMYAANTLFIMAQRSIYDSVGDDVVHEWLTESQTLAEAAGSVAEQTHATVGFAQLAWLRGDHDHAAQLMGGCLSMLRRLGDQRCTGRALHILGERAMEQHELARAEALLRGSVEATALAGQSFVLVSALEALAAALLAQGCSRSAAILLGTANRTRESAKAHLRPIEPPNVELRRSLVELMGAAQFDAAYGEGGGLSPMQALQFASSDQYDDPSPAAR
jgi:predicted ATPase/DNA-binding CsgD family transcriptional regulator